MSSFCGSWQALFIIALSSACSDANSDGATSRGGSSAAGGATTAGTPSTAGNASGGVSASAGSGTNLGGTPGGAGNPANSNGSGPGGASTAGAAGSPPGGSSSGANGSGGVSLGGTSNAGANSGGASMGGVGGQLGSVFTDPFDTFDKNVWSCEYTCPTVTSGNADFQLLAGVAPNNEGSWSKIRYKPRRFTGGRFTVHFALTKRPPQAVWWGVALWDDGPSADGSQFNEINFGYTTDESFPNTQLRFESAKHGKDVSLKVDTGIDLYDGSFHTGALEYDATHVAFYFDGQLLETITDTSVIPTDPMDFIIGPRLVSSPALAQDFSELADSTRIEW